MKSQHRRLSATAQVAKVLDIKLSPVKQVESKAQFMNLVQPIEISANSREKAQLATQKKIKEIVNLDRPKELSPIRCAWS